MNGNLIDAAPFVAFLGGIVMWCGVIFTLLVFKGFIVQGAAWAISEWLMKIADDDAQERICRWLGDKKEIKEYLRRIAVAREN